MYFVFRTVKTAFVTANGATFGTVGFSGTQQMQVLNANEYVLELEDDTPELLDYCASVLVAAEACLLMACNFLFVSIFKLEIGEAINTGTPCKVCFKTDMATYSNNSTFYPITRYEQLSPHWLRSYEQQRLKPLMRGLDSNYQSNPYGRSGSLDPWITVRVVRDSVTGPRHSQSYMGCCDVGDYYWSPKGKLHIVESGPLASCRFPQYESVMSVLYPVFSNCYLNKDGILTKGGFTFSKLQLWCVSDQRIQRKRYRNNASWRQRVSVQIFSALDQMTAAFRDMELAATLEKDLYIYNSSNGQKTHPFYILMSRFIAGMIGFENAVTTQIAGRDLAAQDYLVVHQPLQHAQAQRNTDPTFEQNFDVIVNLCHAYSNFANHWGYNSLQRNLSQFKTSPAAATEPAPAGANFQQPAGFDPDKWMLYTAADAQYIYKNWDQVFRTLETSYNVLALFEKFCAHCDSSYATQTPRFYHRAVAAYDPAHPLQEDHYLVPSTSVSGMAPPESAAMSLRPDEKATAKRCLDPKAGTCPAPLPFWFPKMRSLVLDRSGYDAKKRRFLTPTERATEFPTPHPSDPRPIEDAGAHSDRTPDNHDISQTQKNCDDLRIKANVKTILGAQLGIDFEVPKPLVNGWKKVVGDNAYLTADCSQRKSIDLKLPPNPLVKAGVQTST